MQRISFPASLKLSNVFGTAARRPRYFVRVVSALSLLLFASVASAQNTISTVAGSAPLNNVSPTAAPLVGPQAVVRDGSGNLYVVNDNGVIYKVTPGTVAPSSMSIFAGNNTAGFSPNGTAATSTLTDEPFGAAVDANGNLYYSDSRNCVVREIVGGVVKTVAGNGNCSFTGDGLQATSATLNFPQGIALDGLGNLYIADAGNSVVRRVVLATGIITTYAGTGAQGFPTSGVAASSTPLGFPAGVAVDAAGNLFIADEGINVVCRVDVASKLLTIVAGTTNFPNNAGFSGDGGPATSAMLNEPDGVAVDSAGNIYISDTINAVVREVFSPTNPNTPNQINTIVGNNTFGFSGDGSAALSAELTNPAGLFVDSTTGNLWIADFWANRIRLYTASSKTITTVVGSGAVGDLGPATSASFYFPRGPVLDSQGNLYIVDAENNRIRKVDTSGNIATVVGTGIPCARPSLLCGDGGLATSALIFMPRTVTIEANGDLLVSDDGDGRIREVSGGNIKTVVGSGNQCGSGQNQVPLPCGDGGPALQASLNDARGAVRDAAGNIFLVDAQDNRVREVDTNGTITTIAGGGANDTAPTGCGNGSHTGDGGPAVNSTLNCPLGLDIDSLGNLYVADSDNNVIRKIDTGSPRIITTIAGTGVAGFSGDGAAATSAMLNSPDRVSINGAGNFFISDTNNNRIRRVDGRTGIITTFAGNGTFAFAGDGGPALSASFATPVGVVVTPEGNLYVGDVNNNRIRKVLLNPNAAVSTNTAGFANQPINVAATPIPVTVTNSGDAPLTISSIALTGASVFSLGTSTSPCPVAPATLAVGANCVIEVAFTPTQFVASTGTITITDNAPTTTQIINVTGTGAAALTVSVTGTGSVTSSPTGITACATTCTATFPGNSQVTLTAAPGTNSTFAGFSTNCTPTGALTCSVTMSAAETVTAIFAASGGTGSTFTLNITPASGSTGNGVVSDTSGAINCILSGTSVPTGTCSASFPSGTVETLTAVGSGSSFTGWGGACTGTGTCTVTMNQNQTVAATFTTAPAFTGPYVAGEIFVSGGDGFVYVFKADGTLLGSMNTGQASDTGSAFDPSGNFYVTIFNGLSGVPPVGIVKFDQNAKLVGSFGNYPAGTVGFPESIVFNQAGDLINGVAQNLGTPPQATVPVFEFDPSGNLLATFNVAPENRGSDWVELLPDQKTLLYTSEGDFVHSFNISTNTQNPDVNANNPLTGGTAFAFRVLPSGNLLVADTTFAVELSPTGSTVQTYTPNPAPIVLFALNLDPDGTSFWTADALTGVVYRFDIASGTQLATFTSPNLAASGLAIFGEKTVGNNNLTVTVNGTGTGTVTSSPTGINCTTPSTCLAPFPDNSNVTLTAQAASGSTFASFSANCTPANPQTNPPTCKVPIGTADVTVTATFNTGSSNLTLTVTEGGNGTGTVTSSPTGIACQPTCSAGFASGTVITLTAAGTNGSTFTGWGSGPCEGTGTCTFTISAATTVVANFAQSTNNFTLTVNEAGSGAGTVSSVPAGINCPSTTCSASFASGTVVALTALASDGSTFAGWSGGGCTGTGGCSVTMTAAQTVTATFNSGNSPVTIGLAPGSPSTVNTTPGSSAVFGLTLTSLPGTTGTVTLGCTSASPNITCNIVPSSITLTGKAINVAIVVNTFCKAAVPAFGPSLPGGLVGGLGMLLAGLSLCGALWTFKRRPRLALSFGVLVLIAVGMSACSSLPSSPGGQATKPGLYPLVVTATAPNGAVSSVNLTLNVLP